MRMPETGWRQHFEGPLRKRHSQRDLLKVLRLAAAQQPPKFHKVKGAFPVGTGRSRRHGLTWAQSYPNYQPTKRHECSAHIAQDYNMPVAKWFPSGLARAIKLSWLSRHESGACMRFAPAGTELVA